jgi:soluble lytic murein transglycosylase-like protein
MRLNSFEFKRGPMMKRLLTILGFLALTACGTTDKTEPAPPLYPNETPAMRAQIEHYAEVYDVPTGLVQKVILRESDHRPQARNGPYYGLMQILPQTARTMGYEGPNEGLLDAGTNLKYAVKYLRGAWMVSDGTYEDAVRWYASGYYYEAKKQGLLEETGLRG